MRTNKVKPLELSDLDMLLAERMRVVASRIGPKTGFVSVSATTSDADRLSTSHQADFLDLQVQDGSDASALARNEKKKRATENATIIAGSFVPFAFVLAGTLISTFEPGARGWLPPDFSIYLRCLLIALIFPAFVIPVQSYVNYQRKNISAALLRSFLPATARTQGEQAYARTAIEILDAQNVIGPAEARGMFLALNSLLASERLLETQHASIVRAMNSQTLSAAIAERDSLQARLASASDAVARETIQQSLELCEARLLQTERLAPTLERVQAQQESILQLMASVRTSLAGLGIAAARAKSAPLEDFVGPQAEALRETTRDLQGRARAVEQAVQEVAAIYVR